MRRLLALTCLALIGGALSRTVEIVTADRLELRRVDGQELVIISGPRVEVRVDDDVITAQRVEYNKTNRTLTLVGSARYETTTTGADGRPTPQVLTGTNLVVDIGSEDLAGEDVIVTTSELLIRGEHVERVPGQLRVTSGYFTPCAKCGRTPNDYAFRASRVLLYPGDRLVAYDATLLLVDTPVLYLPVAVLLLGDPDRQPRFEVGRDDINGYFALADLPFVIGSNVQGFTLLRYYQNRTPSFGFGVDMRAYALPFGVRRADLYALANPRPVGESGYDIDFRLNALGYLNLEGTKGGVEYTLNAERRDIGTVEARKGITNVVFTAKAAWDAWNIGVAYVDRFGPEVDGPLPRVLKRPEFTIDPQPYRGENLSADFFFQLGNYRAPSNPLSRRARLEGVNVERWRLLERHVIALTGSPWTGANLAITNTFTGQYYDQGERVVNLAFGVNLTQAITAATSVTAGFNYLRQEGTSPFAFDAIGGRRLSAVSSFGIRTRPYPWLQLEAVQQYDFLKARPDQTGTTFSVNATPRPLSLRGAVRYNFFENQLEIWNAAATLGDGTGPSLSAATSFDRRAGYQPLLVTGAYTEPNRSSTFRIDWNYNLQEGWTEWVKASLIATATRDAILNPVRMRVEETLYTQNARLTGVQSVTWRDVTVGSRHDFLLTDDRPEPEDAREGTGNLFLEAYGPTGALNSWRVSYGGAYDLNRGGWTSPRLDGQLRITRPGSRLAAQAAFDMPGLDQPRFELRSASVAANLDVTPRIGVSGQVLYSSVRSGENVRQTLTLRPVNLTFALGGNEKPDAYFITTLEQTLVFGPNITTQPLQPIFTLIIDRCCWALTFQINPISQYARVGITLPTGGGPNVEFGPEGPRIPGLTTGGTSR